ncbi:hypothetical protein ACQP1V_36385 [Microtetraspora malaysiensis]|uniref:hypothetical protein n=1 Tax=Microtetraspora malaysiensis TaxID=161358 RepID=UPI003D8C6D3D
MIAILDGRLECGTPDCQSVYEDASAIDNHPTYSIREVLRQGAERTGWRVCSGGLDRCPACAIGPAAFLIPGWVQRWTPPAEVPQMLHADSDPDTGVFAVVGSEEAGQ